MNNIISLDNNYYLEVSSPKEKSVTDINKLYIKEIKRKKILLLCIDFKKFNLKFYKKAIKKLVFIKSISKILHIQLGKNNNGKFQIGYLLNYDPNDKDHNDFILALNAILYKTRYERYNYIYDTVCDYLDSYFYGKNLCDFKDNKCGEKRNTSSTWGCCRHYKIKLLGPLTKFVLCEHLNEDYTCSAKCMGCKLFTCDYLKSKGIQFKIKNILLLDAFFNPIQKYFLKYMCFTPKEKVLKRIMLF